MVQKNRTKTVLAVTSLCITFGILVCTLWPFNPFPKNRVQWLSHSNGVRITANSILLSPVPLVPLQRGNSERPVTLEIYLKPYENQGAQTVLEFFQPNLPYQFRIRQYDEGLIVSRQWWGADGTRKQRKLDLDDGLPPGALTLVTITSAEQGTVIYLNGHLKETYPKFRFTTSDLIGRLAIGTATVGPEPWAGEIHGIAIYAKSLSPGEVSASFASWSNDSFPSDPDDCIARYRFAERMGNVIGNDVIDGRELQIPKIYQVPLHTLLTLPWNEFEWSKSYGADVVRNVVGFMPFGFALCAYLCWTRFRGHAAWITIIAGGSLSLSIETLQAFIPQRDSGLTDVITNTLGTVLGVWLFHTIFARKLIKILGLSEAQ